MKKILISFGGKPQRRDIKTDRHYISYGLIRDYSAEVRRLFKSAEPFYLDGCWEYSDEWLKQSAYWQTDARRVLEEDSFGWAFKSICIYDALSMVGKGDGILWVDSNDLLISHPDPIFTFAQQHHIYSHDHYPNYYRNRDWTQRDMFVRMGCDTERYWDTPQLQVNIMAFYKDDFTMAFVEEWVKYSTDYETMIQNIYPNLEGFREHRHEQSVFSILRVKHDLLCARGYPFTIAQEEMGINVKQ